MRLQMHSKHLQATEIIESVYGEAEKSKGGNRNEENMYLWTTRAHKFIWRRFNNVL